MLRKATIDDLQVLTTMNVALRADEQIDNEMSPSEVEARMRDFITGEQYQAYTINIESSIVGYMVVDVIREPPYLRQFFIEASKRGQGLGASALADLRTLLASDRLDVEVMIWNPRAIKFYEKNGFKARVIGLSFSVLSRENH